MSNEKKINVKLLRRVKTTLRPSRPDVMDVAERITYVAAMPASFLELNRAQTLEGLE